MTRIHSRRETVLIMPTPLRSRSAPYRAALEAAGFEVNDPPGGRRLGSDELFAALPEAVALFAWGDPVTAEMIDAAPRLRAIIRIGAGHEAVDLAAATARRIAVATTPGANGESVAEHAFALLLALCREVVVNDLAVRLGIWERCPARPLRSRTLGIVGLGHSGRAMATRAVAFGMRVLACTRTGDPAFESRFGIERRDLDGLLAESDVVSLHLPLTATTRGLLDRRAFARFRPGALLINVARGGLVVEPDLYEALTSGHLAGAGLDTLGAEPPDPRDPLLSLPNVVFSPHLAGIDEAAVDAMGAKATEILIDLRRGRWPEGCIVNEVLREGWQWDAS